MAKSTKATLALIAARAYVQDAIQNQIESTCSPEKKPRAGAVKSSIGLGSWYHPDTMDPMERKHYRRDVKLLELIEEALRSA